MTNRTDELELFKTNIPLTAYASSIGYQIDKRSSSRNSPVMVNQETGDKVIIAKAPDGHWIYFSVRDTRDNGSLIDFVGNRKGLNLGQIRVELRPWLKNPPVALSEGLAYLADLEPVHRDLVAVRAVWAAAEPLSFGQHDYLNRSRGLPAELLSHPALEDRIRTDARGNALFPHYNLDGMCGGELKNLKFTGQIPHGVKGLWGTRTGGQDERLVIAESAIDALSWAAVRGLDRTRLVSTGGMLNPDQEKLIQMAIQKLGRGKIIIATDNDEGGEKIMGFIRSAFHAADTTNMVLIDDRPPLSGQDWNQVLTNGITPPLPPSPAP